MPETSVQIEEEFLNHGSELVGSLATLEPEFWPRQLQRHGVADAIASAFDGLPLDKQKAIIVSVQRLLADRGRHARFADSPEAEHLRQSDAQHVSPSSGQHIAERSG
jgi:hypothetical protein